jgi:hypothetical protein
MTQSKIVRPIFIGSWMPKIWVSLKQTPMSARASTQREASTLGSRCPVRSKAIGVEFSPTELGQVAYCPAWRHVRLAKGHHRKLVADVRAWRPEQSSASQGRRDAKEDRK